MAAFLIYIIRWAVVLTLLYSLYGLFLRRETFHAVNRGLLLTILIASMVLPLCTIKTDQPSLMSRSVSATETVLSESIVTATQLGDDTVLYNPLQREHMMPVYVTIWILAAIYLIGLLYVWLRYLVALVAVARLVAGGQEFWVEQAPRGVKVLSHPKVRVPCSWMRWVLVNPADEANDPILAHEIAHVRLFHSLDMLLAETTANMLWFLPFAWMLRRDLKDIHEYQADQRVLHQGYHRDSYELLLIDRVAAARPQPVVNALNQSSIKKRLKMLYTKQSSRLAMLKAVYVLPLAAIALTAFARPTLISDVESQLQGAEEQAYQVVTQAPGFVPENEPLVMNYVPVPSFSLKKEIEENGRQHHLYCIRFGQRQMWDDVVKMRRGFNFRRVNGETYMQVFGTIESDEETIWLGGPDTYIVNLTTGIRYKARRALMPADLNCDIVVKGCKGQEFCYTIVFPDLPGGIWDAAVYGVPYCQLRGGRIVHNITQYFDR